MKNNKIRRLIKIVALAFLLVLGLGTSLAYGYWVDQIQGDWQVSFSRPITIHVMGLTPPEPVKLPQKETVENPETGIEEEAESIDLSGEQAEALTVAAEEQADFAKIPTDELGTASDGNEGAEVDGKDE